MSFTFPVVMTLGSLAFGLGVGASSVIARAIGEGDMRRVQRFTTNSLTLALTAVILFVALGLLTIDPLFQALGAKPEIMPFVHGYMRIWYFGMVFLVVPMVGNSAIRAAGNALTPSIIMIFSGGAQHRSRSAADQWGAGLSSARAAGSGASDSNRSGGDVGGGAAGAPFQRRYALNACARYRGNALVLAGHFDGGLTRSSVKHDYADFHWRDHQFFGRCMGRRQWPDLASLRGWSRWG